MNPQADELNKEIEWQNEEVLHLLSDKGKRMFFPSKSILAQTAEARKCEINATIGIAKCEANRPLHLNSVSKHTNMEPEEMFPYAPSWGLPELRDKWLGMMIEKNPSLEKKPLSRPIVTTGITGGLSVVGDLFLDKEDLLIVPDMYWGNYNLIFKEKRQCDIKTFPLFLDGKFNAEGFGKAIEESGKKNVAIILNFPNNPTGYTPTSEETDRVIEGLAKASRIVKRILVIVDDAYFGLTYESGLMKESIFTRLCGLEENVLAVKLDGATKEDYVWGFRVGFITFGIKKGSSKLFGALESKACGAIRAENSNASRASQSLLLRAFKEPNYRKEKEENFKLLKERYQLVKKLLNENKQYGEEFEALPFNSGYFMCIRLKNKNAFDVRKVLLERYSTGVIAWNEQDIRIAFSSCRKEDLPKVFENVYKACKEA